ncbi:unnamed protein product [Nezara viridula]|uniref:Uncharacterized protein n=1 Tax=Nezara viridula TaxID=85310 RepID=A0A9P0MPE7_NEZVI|nr:unnamed protein product [Nezara viridula]
MAHEIYKSFSISSESSSSELPDEEVTSEVKFQQILDKFMKKTRPRPKVINGNPLWKRILSEHAKIAWHSMNQEETCLPAGIDTEEWKYLDKEIFPTLLPAIEETMNLAERLKVEEGKFRAFNYVDTLIHYMLNLNIKPDEPIKMIEDFEEIKEHLKKFPKPSLPKHKIWSRHKAATLIQSNVRGWLVRKRPEVFEMRQFWKVMREELQTRKGPAVARSNLEDIIPMAQEISSDTDGTEYNDGEQFFKWRKPEEDDGHRLNQLNLLALAQKSGKAHSKHGKSITQREKSRAQEYNFREATVQTERFVYRMDSDRHKKNPFEQSSLGSGHVNSLGSYHSKDKPKYKRKETEEGTKKPEISREDIEIPLSFESLSNKKKNNKE